ncbi:MAG: hypothetical protein ACR2M0_01545 [Chloroflexia bacterium]
MRGARLLLAALILAVPAWLTGCDVPFVPAPTPTAANTATPAPPTTTPGPTSTPPTATLVPTATSAPTATATPVPTPTEGPVRTPVGGAAGPEFGAALAAMDAAPAYHYRLQIALGPPEARYVMTGTGTYQPSGNYDTNFNALGFNSELLLLNGATYVRAYGVWHQGRPDSVLYPLGPPPNIPDLLGLLTYTRDAALVGDGNETLNGLAVRHYRFQLRPDALIAGNLAPASGDLWADAETHHYARIILSLTSAAGPPDNNGTLQLDFSDYGTPVTPMQLLLTPAP